MASISVGEWSVYREIVHTYICNQNDIMSLGEEWRCMGCAQINIFMEAKTLNILCIPIVNEMYSCTVEFVYKVLSGILN